MKSKSSEHQLYSGPCQSEENMGHFLTAFQPIVDCQEKRIVGYEALVRGQNNEDADVVIASVKNDSRYAFDQMCRVRAIENASRLGLDLLLSINFLPNAIVHPEQCLQATLEVAGRFKFPTENIIFEFTEVEEIEDISGMLEIIRTYRDMGFKTAIDDFGSGYSGLGLLADLQTDIVKLDMSLIREIDKDAIRQCILKHSLSMMNELNIDVIAEGIESKEEMLWLQQAGIRFMQGFYFAEPEINRLPLVDSEVFI
ncbi:EAL domain-containing protein [Vibrio mangrovi]|uniref:Blue light- and temperature-regulated antirepressor YcgF n=1 Tax=Vibrio mangrovi TaxID=474394 RepID=A0A1Y6IZC7_9VIBR|nr:EAL domain-containing protein [Vibrio mangrovi]MDW6005370.1 EAL domain-containing protein [Vibrio mangrovi]SMS02190.1 Blue light- and temperature-regulated antirepressor YcgF [Vibrio mangrovi]